MSNDDIVYEVKKDLSVSNIMQLIDLNGTKKNFQSEFVFQINDPSKKVSICVLNQDELDNGSINFEETERGKYSRRITYQNDKHINHYIAVKKHPQDRDEKNVECNLVIHMRELPPPLPDIENNESVENTNNSNNINLNPNMKQETRESLKNSLKYLRESDEYKKLSDDEDDDYIEDLNKDMRELKSSSPPSSFNSYIIIGLIFLFLFGYIFYIKKIKRNK